MRKRPLLALPVIAAILLASAPAGASAQEGRVNFTHSVKLDIERPDEFKTLGVEIPTHNSTEMQLLFNSTKSVWGPVPDTNRTGRETVVSVTLTREEFGMMLASGAYDRLMAAMRGESGGPQRNQGTLVQRYVDFEDGSVTESLDFMGRAFLVEDERPAYEWKLSGEQRELLGYIVQMATTVRDGKPVEAWFTPQIPVQAGPATFGGLPGLILMVSTDDGDTVYLATEVDLAGLDEGEIGRPKDGSRVSRDEYESIVADKLKELEETRGSGRRPFR